MNARARACGGGRTWFWLVVGALVGASALETSAQGLGQPVQAVILEKDQRGRLTADSAARLESTRASVRQHGALRAWVVANAPYDPDPPTQEARDAQQRRIRAVQEHILATVRAAMSNAPLDELRPELGPYLSITVNIAGLEALVHERKASAFWVLVPTS